MKSKKIQQNEKIKKRETISPVCELKIAVLGKTLVGKSALTFRFINDRFPTEHDTTIEDQYRVNVNIEGVDCRLGKFRINIIKIIKKSSTQQVKTITRQC
jgi:GTPase SAR1 family protein